MPPNDNRAQPGARSPLFDLPGAPIDHDHILALLRLAQWAAEASPAIAQIAHLREQVPSFREVFDALTQGLALPELRNAGQLVADVLAVTIEILEDRKPDSEGVAT